LAADPAAEAADAAAVAVGGLVAVLLEAAVAASLGVRVATGLGDAPVQLEVDAAIIRVRVAAHGSARDLVRIGALRGAVAAAAAAPVAAGSGAAPAARVGSAAPVVAGVSAVVTDRGVLTAAAVVAAGRGGIAPAAPRERTHEPARDDQSKTQISAHFVTSS